MAKHALILLSFLYLFIGTGCNEFNKIQKSDDIELKYNKAIEYYNKKDYVKAQMLFDELYAIMRSTERGKEVMYYLAYCNYHNGDYILGGYQFKQYFRTFPLSDKAEECLYMSAYCHYLSSPTYSLDQQDTYQAIDEFQYFVQIYPDSPRVQECNKLIDNLRSKIEKKKFEITKMYYNIDDYKATITCVEQLLQEFPASKYREECLYMKLDARYKLALNSVDAKKEQRIKDTINEYNAFVAAYPVSEFSKRARQIYESALSLQQEVANEKKTK